MLQLATQLHHTESPIHTKWRSSLNRSVVTTSTMTLRHSFLRDPPRAHFTPTATAVQRSDLQWHISLYDASSALRVPERRPVYTCSGRLGNPCALCNLGQIADFLLANSGLANPHTADYPTLTQQITQLGGLGNLTTRTVRPKGSKIYPCAGPMSLTMCTAWNLF